VNAVGIILFLTVAIITGVLVHEISHLAVARLMGCRTRLLYLWFPTPLFHVKLGTTWIAVAFARRVGGFCILRHNETPERVSSKLAFIFAGAFGNALVAPLLWIGARHAGGFGEIFLFAAAAGNSFMAVSALFPRMGRVADRRMPTDGLQAYRVIRDALKGTSASESDPKSAALLRLSERPEEAVELITRWLAESQDNARWLRFVRAAACVGLGRALEAKAECEALLAERADDPIAPSVKANLAWALAVFDETRDLPRADQLSSEILARASDDDRLGRHFVRGVVLMHLGRLEEASTHLRFVYARQLEPTQRGSCAAYMSLTELRANRRGRAQRWLRRAARLEAPERALALARVALEPTTNAPAPA